MNAAPLSYTLDAVDRSRPNLSPQLRRLPFLASSTLAAAAPPSEDIWAPSREASTGFHTYQAAQIAPFSLLRGATSITRFRVVNMVEDGASSALTDEDHRDPLRFSVSPVARDAAPKVASVIVLSDLPRRPDRFSVNLLPADFDD